MNGGHPITIERLQDYYRKTEPDLLVKFLEFLRFETISAHPGTEEHFDRCVKWLRGYLREGGFDVQTVGLANHPVILAQHMEGEHLPTVLFYNHYDVQPVDPLEAWETPPFEPKVRGREVYARGASDNKGQCLYLMAALRALRDLTGGMPLNVKLCIDGEEESGSEGLFKAVDKDPGAFSADYLVIVDVGVPEPKRPSISLGVRGIVTMTLELVSSREDLHSGSHGGLVPNPNHAMVELLSTLRDSKGRVAVSGFYDDVREPERELLEVLDLSFDPQAYEELLGARPVGGEISYGPLERVWLRPTLEINGLCGGYCGPGFKTVIPSRSIAKVSCRLVPDQNPQRIAELVREHLMERVPEGVELSVQVHEGWGLPCRCHPDSYVVRAFQRAYEQVMGCPCSLRMEGGSIPVASRLAEASGAQTLFMGYSLPTDRAHAPNERFGLDRLQSGFLTIALGIQLLAGG